MRAIVIKGFGGLDSLVIETLADPEPKAGHAVMEVKAFGINHAETHSKKVDAVLDLVGNTTFMDSLQMLRRGGRMCLAGWLGGLDPVKGFNPLLQMPSGVYFTFFGSFVFGTPQFPVSDIPMQEIVDKAAAGVFKAKPAKVFKFDEIRDAHEAMESNQSNGKMVVLV
jgi:NADPH:quinone reductase